jgi:phage tail sheath protein FI
LFALKDGPPFNFLYMPPPARERNLGMSALVVGARFCRRHHALLLVDPPCSWTSVQQAADGLDDWPFHSADALMFFPRLRTLDRVLGSAAEFPPSAAAIGALLRDESDAIWNEAAEPPLLRPSAAPALWVDRQQRARLAHRGVNTLRATRTPARDAIPACTLAGELVQGQDARMLAARRLALQVRASIERGTRWVSIEGNTPRSRERVCRQVEYFLQSFAQAGAFAGADRNRHYFVICDERLNGPLQLASGVFRLVYGYQPRNSPTRMSWLVEHGLGASRTRAVSLNQLAACELEVG